MLYFAYGSNLLLPRMRKRLPDADTVGIAVLPGHELRFHKRGMDGSAKCNALVSPDHDALVLGVVYRIPRQDKVCLDRIEGLGSGYRDVRVQVELDSGQAETVLTYMATHIDGRLKPFGWYREHVLAGARGWRLPTAYVARIEAVEAIRDPDFGRSARERAIHG